MQCDKQHIALDEEVSFTITAQLLSLPATQLFLGPGTTDYTLRLILPPGFEQTGGNFADYVSGNLLSASQPVMTYHLKGRFRSVTAGTGFRLLRSHGQANDQSLFVEKAVVMLQTLLGEPLAKTRKTITPPVGPAGATLYVTSENRATGAARAAAPDYIGYIDFANCNKVTGWILDGRNFSQSQEVDIYVNGEKAATLIADLARPDVAKLYGVNDFNGYGYVWIIPDYYKTGAPLTLSVRPTGTAVDLRLSPVQTDACPGTARPTTPVSTSAVVATPVGGDLQLLAPTYNCATGAITFNTSGGNGSPIRYRAIGISDWTTNPDQFLDAGSRVNADTPPFTLYAEQSGRTITYTWSRQAACNTTPTPTITPTPVENTLTLLAPTYNCATGAISFRSSGGNGTPIRYRSPGISDWTTNPDQFLDAGSRVNADTPPFTLYAEQSGRIITYTWSRQAACGTTPPPTVTPPPTANALTLLAPTYNCATGAITFNASGGNGTPVRYRATGISGWTTNPNQFLDAGSRVNADTPPFTLYAEQSGFTVTYTWSRQAACNTTPPTGAGDPSSGCTPPSAPVLSAPGGTQVCNNSTVTLTATGCSGTVTWSNGQRGVSIGVSAAGTYSATCLLNGCVSVPSNQQTVTACPATGSAGYNRVLYVGNSITLHGGNQFFIVNPQNPKRGMAATSPDKDYLHLLSARHRALNPAVDNRTFASWNLGGQLDEATGPYWESNSTKNGIELDRFDPVAAWKPDLVYIRLGENVNDGEITNPALYQSRLKALIDKLISQSPGAKVVLSTSVWSNPNYDAAIRAVGAERNYPIANFSDMWPNRLINGYYALNPGIYGDQGVNNHPDDDGMAHIAEGLWAVTPK